jgi:hypothetical protein
MTLEVGSCALEDKSGKKVKTAAAENHNAFFVMSLPTFKEILFAPA